MSKVLRSIRENCLQCSGGSSKEVALCVIPDCHLYPYRYGGREDIEEHGDKLIIDATGRGEDTVVTRGFYEIVKVGKQLKIKEIKKGNG